MTSFLLADYQPQDGRRLAIIAPNHAEGQYWFSEVESHLQCPLGPHEYVLVTEASDFHGLGNVALLWCPGWYRGKHGRGVDIAHTVAKLKLRGEVEEFFVDELPSDRAVLETSIPERRE